MLRASHAGGKILCNDSHSPSRHCIMDDFYRKHNVVSNFWSLYYEVTEHACTKLENYSTDVSFIVVLYPKRWPCIRRDSKCAFCKVAFCCDSLKEDQRRSRELQTNWHPETGTCLHRPRSLRWGKPLFHLRCLSIELARTICLWQSMESRR